MNKLYYNIMLIYFFVVSQLSWKTTMILFPLQLNRLLHNNNREIIQNHNNTSGGSQSLHLIYYIYDMI
jgi:hypothetical protein